MKANNEKTHDFNVSIIGGEFGEAEIIKGLDKYIAEKKIVFQGYRILDYQDVRAWKLYQNKDIDFIVRLINDKTGAIINKTLEVKTDSFYDADKFVRLEKNYNLFIETKSSKNKMGCMLKTDADILLYYYITLGYFYVLVPDNYMPLLESMIAEMDEWDEEYLATLENVTADTKKKYFKVISNGSYRSAGYATPVWYLQELKQEMGLILEKHEHTKIAKAVFDEMVKEESARRKNQAA